MRGRGPKTALDWGSIHRHRRYDVNRLRVNLGEEGLSPDFIFQDRYDRPEELLSMECPVYRVPLGLLIEAVASLSRRCVSRNINLHKYADNLLVYSRTQTGAE